MTEVYPHLKKYWARLELEAKATVLVPLCGKSLDLAWLADRGHRVIGVEVSEKAIEEFLDENDRDYTLTSKSSFRIYRTGNITLWAGDFFNLEAAWLPHIAAIYDKASLIALPGRLREQYARKLIGLSSAGTRILMNTFEYPSSEMNGPPFAVFEEEIENLFGHRFKIRLLHAESILERHSKFQWRGLSSYLTEKVYHLY